MHKRLKLSTIAVLFCSMVSAGTIAAQTSTTVRSYDANKSTNYGFVSPNTRNDLKLEDAINSLFSREESNLMSKSSELGCRMHARVRAWRTVGSWSDGAEHSILLRMNANESAMRYLVSSLGRDAQQKSVLYFHKKRGGPARLYIVFPGWKTSRMSTLAAILDHAGISFRTLVPLKQTTLIYVVDSKRELKPKLRAAAKRLRARVYSQEGSAEFIGNDSNRQKGALEFKKEIAEYEATHPPLPATCREARLKRSGPR